MALTYYDMEKLMRMVYRQKFVVSLKNDGPGRRKMRACEPPHGQVACRIRTSGAAAK